MAGHDVWIDNQLSGGVEWWEHILEQIRESDAFLSLVSQGSLASTACTSERHYASALKKPILPVLIEPLRPQLLPPDLARLHVMDFTAVDEFTGYRLIGAITRLPSPKALPDPLPQAPDIPLSYLSELSLAIRSPSLSFDEQLALVSKLRDAVDRGDDRDGAIELARLFNERQDLYVLVGRQLTELFRVAVSPAQSMRNVVRAPSSTPATLLKPDGDAAAPSSGVDVVKDRRLTGSNTRTVAVTMPALGEAVTEGTVIRWLKAVGDSVEADEPLLEVSTDKGDAELPAPTSGTLLAITVGEDEIVQEGDELAVIATASGSGATPLSETPSSETPSSKTADPDAPATNSQASDAPASDAPAEPEAAEPATALREETAAAPDATVPAATTWNVIAGLMASSAIFSLISWFIPYDASGFTIADNQEYLIANIFGTLGVTAAAILTTRPPTRYFGAGLTIGLGLALTGTNVITAQYYGGIGVDVFQAPEGGFWLDFGSYLLILAAAVLVAREVMTVQRPTPLVLGAAGATGVVLALARVLPQGQIDLLYTDSNLGGGGDIEAWAWLGFGLTMLAMLLVPMLAVAQVRRGVQFGILAGLGVVVASHLLFWVDQPVYGYRPAAGFFLGLVGLLALGGLFWVSLREARSRRL